MTKFLRTLFLIALVFMGVGANAKIKYYSDGKLTYGNTTSYEFYTQTINATGVYLTIK